jgi:hypothetical protein
VKERPILFQGAMVRALLAGTKTQTRRVVKWRGLEPGLNLQFSGLSVERSGSNFVLSSPTRTSHAYRSVPQPCPYGQPGDRLWVRETWAYHVHAQAAMRDEDGPWVYAADGAPALQMRLCDRWRPSIHMPRWACRLVLEVTSVRVERLQDISEADAQAEGCDLPARDQSWNQCRRWYRDLWEQINGTGSWDANPWVWVVEFKRAEAA